MSGFIESLIQQHARAGYLFSSDDIRQALGRSNRIVVAADRFPDADGGEFVLVLHSAGVSVVATVDRIVPEEAREAFLQVCVRRAHRIAIAKAEWERDPWRGYFTGGAS